MKVRKACWQGRKAECGCVEANLKKQLADDVNGAAILAVVAISFAKFKIRFITQKT